MNSRDEKPSEQSSAPWVEVAVTICRSPLSAVTCPACGERAVSGEWHRLDLVLRETLVDMHCSACETRETVHIALPDGAAPYFPTERYSLVAEALTKQAESFAARVRQHARAMPAAVFSTNPLWSEAKWSATTYQWHPTSEAPPLMGLVFDNEEAGLEIFREAEQQMNHEDRFEEIRISIIEGSVPEQQDRPGYSVHICADPEALCAHATMEDFVVDSSIVPFLGQWNRHYPIPGTPLLLPRFKEEFEKHKEFMLAPTVRGADGNLYMKPELGIIKNVIIFRDLADIKAPDDIDAAALLLPELVTPPE